MEKKIEKLDDNIVAVSDDEIKEGAQQFYEDLRSVMMGGDENLSPGDTVEDRRAWIVKVLSAQEALGMLVIGNVIALRRSKLISPEADHSLTGMAICSKGALMDAIKMEICTAPPASLDDSPLPKGKKAN